VARVFTARQRRGDFGYAARFNPSSRRYLATLHLRAIATQLRDCGRRNEYSHVDPRQQGSRITPDISDRPHWLGMRIRMQRASQLQG
jgi:hypothetical protein